MGVTKIEEILKAHNVPYYIESGRIYADSMAAFAAKFEEVIDLTEYTKKELYHWLGY